MDWLGVLPDLVQPLALLLADRLGLLVAREPLLLPRLEQPPRLVGIDLRGAAEPLDRGAEIEALDLLDQANDIAAIVADSAGPAILVCKHLEALRRRAAAAHRAWSDQAAAGAAQPHILLGNMLDRIARADVVDLGLRQAAHSGVPSSASSEASAAAAGGADRIRLSTRSSTTESAWIR